MILAVIALWRYRVNNLRDLGEIGEIGEIGET